MIKTLVIDDEPYSCEALVELLAKCCSDVVQVAEVCHSGAGALKAIQKHLPDLIFLDIEMPQMNGFELLEKVGKINFEIIFTTSYDQYAIKAIRMSALDYLLKPIDREELQMAIEKVKQSIRPRAQQIEMLLQKLNNPGIPMNKIALPTMEGLQLVKIDSIISCTSDSNYTIFRIKGEEKILVSKTLKEIEELLSEYSFLRVHHSSVVNLNEISKYVKGEGGYLVMSDGYHVDVSRSRKEMLLIKLQPPKL